MTMKRNCFCFLFKAVCAYVNVRANVNKSEKNRIANELNEIVHNGSEKGSNVNELYI